MSTLKNLMFKNSPTLTNSWEGWISLCAAITGKEKPHTALSAFHMNLLVLKIPRLISGVLAASFHTFCLIRK